MSLRLWSVVVVGLALAIITIAGIAWYWPGTVPTMERDGGAVLVYEVEGDDLPEEYEPEQLVRVLQVRFASAGLRGVQVKPLDRLRFQIAVPGVKPSRFPDVVAED